MDKAEIREIANGVLNRKRTARTEAQYRKAWARLAGEHWRAYSERQDLRKATAYEYKAAWQFGMAEHALGQLREADRARREGDREREQDCRNEATAAAEAIKEEADYERRNRYTDKPGYQPTTRRRKASKRRSLRGLPDNWQGRVIDELSEPDQWAAITMMLTGCRPAELAKGIDLGVMEDGFEVAIEGAKTGQGYGQEWRDYALRGDYAATFAKMLRETGKESVAVQLSQEGADPVDAFRKRVKRAAVRAGLPDVSAYSFRHAFAAGLKTSGMSRADIAGAMGHAVDATQSQYGHALQGSKASGGLVIDAIETAQPVRPTYNPPTVPEPSAPSAP
jgi:integrase